MKGALKSKKVQAAIIGLVASFLGYFVPGMEETVDKIVQVIMAYIVGQGVADFGKSAKQLDA